MISLIQTRIDELAIIHVSSCNDVLAFAENASYISCACTYDNVFASRYMFIAIYISCPLRSWIAPARQQCHAFSYYIIKYIPRKIAASCATRWARSRSPINTVKIGSRAPISTCTPGAHIWGCAFSLDDSLLIQHLVMSHTGFGGAHAQQGLRYLVRECVCVCLSVRLLPRFLRLRATRQRTAIPTGLSLHWLHLYYCVQKLWREKQVNKRISTGIRTIVVAKEESVLHAVAYPC